MTVLQRNDARGFDSKRSRGFVVALAMAVVGVAAAFGISQIVNGDQAIDVSRGAAMQANVETLTRTGLAQQQAILERALSQNNAIESRSAFEKAMGIEATTWTFEDELAAIHGRTGTEPTSSVGAVVSQPTPEQALAAIHGRTGYQPAVTTTPRPTVEQELAAIEARTGVQQSTTSAYVPGASESLSRVGSWTAPVSEGAYVPGASESLSRVGSWAAPVEELGWSFEELAEFHARNGYEPKTYTELPAGVR